MQQINYKIEKTKNAVKNQWSNTLITSRYYLIFLHFFKNQILCI